MRCSTWLVAVIALAAAPAHAQTPRVDQTPSVNQTPSVEVMLGPAVQARVGELGRTALDQQREDLARIVASALSRAPGGLTGARLVLQDIEPTRPTSAQLGASVGLSPMSIGLGGAAITGEVVSADGQTRPLRYRFFQPTLATQLDRSPWGDAQEAFGRLAGALARGQAPDDTAPWPAPHQSEAPTGTRIP